METYATGLNIRLFACGVELGALCVLIKCGRLKPYLNKSEAFRQYGRKNVEYWVAQGLLKPRKDGDGSAAWRIDRMELECLVKANELLAYL